MSIEKKKITFIEDKFKDILDYIKDVLSISKIIMFKIDQEKIFIYSAVGGTGGESLKLFRAHFLDTSEYIKDYLIIDTEINYIIAKGDKLHKALSIMDYDESEVTLDLNLKYNDERELFDARGGVFKCKNLKFSALGAERRSIVNTDREKLSYMVSDDRKIWSFNMSQQEFKTVKKFASLENGEDNKIFTVRAIDGKVSISEKSDWEIDLCEIDDTMTREVSFVKKFFNNIKDNSDYLKFKIFDSFVVVETDNSLLLMGYETSFED